MRGRIDYHTPFDATGLRPLRPMRLAPAPLLERRHVRASLGSGQSFPLFPVNPKSFCRKQAWKVQHYVHLHPVHLAVVLTVKAF